MSKSLPRRVYLAELDALLDTRAAILNRELGDKFIDLLTTGYFFRNVDSFPDLPFEKFMDMYRARDKSILGDAVATPLIKMIGEYVQSVIYNTMATPYHYEPVLMINIYPYKLEKDEMEALASGISIKFKDKVAIELIDVPYNKLGPKFIRDNDVAYIAIYDYIHWLNIHIGSGEFSQYPSPTVGLVAPKIIFAKPTNQLTPNLERDFQSLEDIVGSFISVHYSPIADFCLNVPMPLLEAAKKGKEEAAEKQKTG